MHFLPDYFQSRLVAESGPSLEQAFLRASGDEAHPDQYCLTTQSVQLYLAHLTVAMYAHTSNF